MKGEKNRKSKAKPSVSTPPLSSPISSDAGTLGGRILQMPVFSARGRMRPIKLSGSVNSSQLGSKTGHSGGGTNSAAQPPVPTPAMAIPGARGGGGSVGEASRERLAEAHQNLSRSLTRAEAHLLRQELLNTGTPESFPSLVCYCFLRGFSSQGQGFPEVNVLPNPSATPRNRIPPQHRDALSYHLSSALSQQPSVTPCVLFRESSALSNDFKRHTLASYALSYGGKYPGPRRNNLFRRGGMCNAPRGQRFCFR